MPVDTHLPRAVPAAAVVAHEPRVVVPGRVNADGLLELGYDRQRGEGPSAVRRRADDALGRDVGDGDGDAFEDGRVFAETAREREAGAVFEADRVRDLAFQRVDIVRLGRRGGGGDAVFPRVETETFGEADGIGAGHGGTETLDGREDLLVEVPFDVGL